MFVFFFNDTATTEIYTLSLHDALPISRRGGAPWPGLFGGRCAGCLRAGSGGPGGDPHGGRRVRSAEALGDQRPGCVARSEEHTSELQSRQYLVCRLLLEKKKKTYRLCF